MDSVKYFNAELSSLYEVKPPISKAKMTAITKGAIKAVKFYKHAVQSVEKFIQKCRPDYKIPGLYVIDSIVRQSRHQFGPDKDVFAPRFAKNIQTTFYYIYQCAPEEKSKVIRVLNLWQKNAIFQPEVIHPLFDMADPLHPKYKEQALLASARAMGKPDVPLAMEGLNGASNRDSTGDKEEGSQLLMGSLPTVGSSDMSLNTRLQQLQHLLGDNKAEGNPEPGQVRFNKKLLDFDYDEDDDDGGGGGGMDHSDTPPPNPKALPPPHQPGQPMDALGNLLANPNILRHLQNIQHQISQPVPMPNMLASSSQSSQETKNEAGNAEVRGMPPPPFGFPMDMTQPPPGFPHMPMGMSLPHLGIPMPMNMGMGMPMHPGMPGGPFQPNPPMPVPHNQNEPRPSPPPTPTDRLEASQRREDGGFGSMLVEKDEERKRRSRSRSNSRNRQRRGRRSRSRSRNRNDNRRRRTRSRSRNRTQRSSSREREDARGKNKERERQRERVKRGLPELRKEHLSVCSTTLWVGHLSKLVTQEILFNTFGECGEVVSIDQIPPRGCAFVCMLRRQDAVKALKDLAKFKLQGKQITLAWAAGKGVKSKEWKDYWDVEYGAAFIPWSKLAHMKRSDLEALEDGGTIDEDTLPPWLKEGGNEAQTAAPAPAMEHPGLPAGFVPLTDMQGMPLGVPNPHAPPLEAQPPFDAANGLPFGHPPNFMPPNMGNHGMPPPLGLLGPGGLLPGMPFLPPGIRLPQLPPHMMPGINLPPHNPQGPPPVGEMGPPPGGPNMNLPHGFPFHPFPPQPQHQHHPNMMLPGQGPVPAPSNDNSQGDKPRDMNTSGVDDDMDLVEMEEASETRSDNEGGPSAPAWNNHNFRDQDGSQDRGGRPLPSLLDRLRNLANNEGPLPPPQAVQSKSPGKARDGSPRPLFSDAEREVLLGGFGGRGGGPEGDNLLPGGFGGMGGGNPRMPVSPGLANSLRGAPINMGNDMGMHFMRPGADFPGPPMDPLRRDEEMLGGRGLLGPVPNMPGSFNGMRPPMPMVNPGPRGMMGPRGPPMVRGPTRFFRPPHGPDFEPEDDRVDWRERERDEWNERGRGDFGDFGGGRGRGRGPPTPHWRERDMGPPHDRDYGEPDYAVDNEYMESPRGGRGRGGWGGGRRDNRDRGRGGDRHRRDWDRGDRRSGGGGGDRGGRDNREHRRRWTNASPEKREEPIASTLESTAGDPRNEPEPVRVEPAITQASTESESLAIPASHNPEPAYEPSKEGGSGQGGGGGGEEKSATTTTESQESAPGTE